MVIVQAGFGLTQSALVLPGLLEKLADRSVMLTGIGLMIAGMFVGPWVVGHASLTAL